MESQKILFPICRTIRLECRSGAGKLFCFYGLPYYSFGAPFGGLEIILFPTLFPACRTIRLVCRAGPGNYSISDAIPGLPYYSFGVPFGCRGIILFPVEKNQSSKCFEENQRIKVSKNQSL